MKEFNDIRVLLDIELFDRTFHYSDRDGPAHQFSSSSDGRVIVESDIVLYSGLIVNPASIREAFDPESGSSSISNVSITVFNRDRLDLIDHPVALESATANLYLVRGDNYDEVIDSLSGRIDEVRYDQAELSFQIKSEEITLFRRVPETLLEEDTFQTRLVLQEPQIETSDPIRFRFAKAGNSAIDRVVVRKIYHSALAAPREVGEGLPYVDNYWVGARVDVIDAAGAFGDPESEVFCIGEFAIVIDSEDNWIQLPTVVDRYAIYPFIDDGLRQMPAVTPTADIPYEVRDIINNTMQNTAKMTDVALVNGDFSDAGGIISVADLGGTPNRVRVSTSAAHGMVAGDYVNIQNSTSYDGFYEIKNVAAAATFDIESAFGTTSTGSWCKAWEFNYPPWGIAGNALVRSAGTAATVAKQLRLNLVEGATYNVTLTISAISVPAGKALVMYLGASSVRITATGTYTYEMVAVGTGGVDGIGFYADDNNVTATIDDISIEELGKPVIQITRKSLPENSDSVGRPLPIVYGEVQKMWAVWAISSKSTRQNSISAGDDTYIIAGHRIFDKNTTEIEVYFGLDERAAEWMSVKPGHIDFVPNPLPKSISEIERWHESGYDLRSGDPLLDVCPLHKLVEITTNTGEIVTAVKLRGDEYDGWKPDPSGEDGDIALVDGKPQFPIRYGLGNCKVYVSFRGYADEDGTITGVKGGLIDHPVDIIKHFLLYHTNIDGDRSQIDEQSFAEAKARLPNWRFGVAITDGADGREILERLTRQCKTTWDRKHGQIRLTVIDLEGTNPVRVIDEVKHFIGRQTWERTPLTSIFNDFVVRYGYNAITEKFDRVIRRNKSNDQRCRDSYARYGVVRSFDEVELDDVHDSYTANAYTDHLVALHALSRTSFSTGIRLLEDTMGMVAGEVVWIAFHDDDGNVTTTPHLVVSLESSSTGFDARFLELG